MHEQEESRWDAVVFWLKDHPRRATALGVFLLGCALTVISNGGGDPFQDFTAGLLMGLGVGCMAVGTVLLAFSLRREK